MDTTALSKYAAATMASDRGIKIRTGYPVDMAHMFRTWFIWGFWDKIFQITIVAVFLPMAFLCKQNTRIMNILYYVFQSLAFTSFLIWFILGFFWRFSRGGRVASGDKLERVAGMTDEAWNGALESAKTADGYQMQSGMFMAVYFGLVIAFTIIFISCGSVTATLMCVLSSRSSLKEEDKMWFEGGSSEESSEAAKRAQQ